MHYALLKVFINNNFCWCNLKKINIIYVNFHYIKSTSVSVQVMQP